MARGNDWNGQGEMPDWMRAARNASVDPDFFRIASRSDAPPTKHEKRYQQVDLFD